MKVFSNLIKVISALSLILCWIYSIYYDDSCLSAQQEYSKVSLNIRIVKISPYGRSLKIEGYNKGDYIIWRDFGVLFKSNSHKIAEGDSIWKNSNDSTFYVRKKVSDGLLRFHYKCDK